MTNLHLIFVVMKFSMLNAQFSNAQICISNFSLFFVSTFLLNKKKKLSIQENEITFMVFLSRYLTMINKQTKLPSVSEFVCRNVSLHTL